MRPDPSDWLDPSVQVSPVQPTSERKLKVVLSNLHEISSLSVIFPDMPHKNFSIRVSYKSPLQSVLQEWPTRLPQQIVSPEYHIRSHKGVLQDLQESLTRLSLQECPQECPTRGPHKNVPQGGLARVCPNYKGVLQVSRKSALRKPISHQCPPRVL